MTGNQQPTTEITEMTPLSFRAAQRLAARVAALAGETVDPGSHTNQQLDADTIARQKRRSARQRQRTRESAQRWRNLRETILADICAFRSQEEASVLHSPDLSRSALFAVPSSDQVPAIPDWKGGGTFPHPDDRSDAAAEWHLGMASRAEALRRRAEERSARSMRPHNTWRRTRSVGEHGGKRPGSAAFPSAWTSYLLRVDPDGIGGDGWNGTMGRALRRMERDYTDLALWQAIWTYTEPRHFGDMARVQLRLGVGQRQAYRWLDAGARRVVAEMATISVGRRYARYEIRAAEEGEALAWKSDPQR